MVLLQLGRLTASLLCAGVVCDLPKGQARGQALATALVGMFSVQPTPT